MIDKTAKRSRELFSPGYYCAESVLMAVAEAKDIQSELIPMIATGFCSGVARTGGTCGAVNGAIMALGLVFGRTDPSKPVDESYDAVGEFLKAFQQKFQSTNCQQLLKVDLGTDEGQNSFNSNNLIGQCLGYAEEATRMAMTIIEAKK